MIHHALCAAAVLLASVSASLPASAQPAAPGCTHAGTQTRMNECAYDDFLAATAAYSTAYKALSDLLSRDDVRQLQRTQKAWMAYRTATCDFEASGVKGGSAHGMVQWQCAARYTRVRTAELRKMASCPEGDLSCPPLKR